MSMSTIRIKHCRQSLNQKVTRQENYILDRIFYLVAEVFILAFNDVRGAVDQVLYFILIGYFMRCIINTLINFSTQ